MTLCVGWVGKYQGEAVMAKPRLFQPTKPEAVKTEEIQIEIKDGKPKPKKPIKHYPIIENVKVELKR